VVGNKTSFLGRAYEYCKREGVLSGFKLGFFWAPSFAYYKLSGDSKYNDDGVDLFSQDWDNAIILDACRYDAFKKTHGFPGSLEKKKSKASSTSEFIKANFSNKKLDDVIYISGNTWFRRLKQEINSEVHALFDVSSNTERSKIERTVKCAKYCEKEFPNKRLLIHFIPPHHPLVGSTAKDHLPSADEQLERPFYERIRKGEIEISDETLMQAYTENLERIFPEVKELLSSLDGKTIITSDHGEMLGEKSEPIPLKYYGHVPGLYTDELTEIPWYVHPHKDRKDIISERPQGKVNFRFSENDKPVKDRLEDLGYKMEKNVLVATTHSRTSYRTL